MYFSHGAVHAPLQAPEKDIKKYEGMYDRGWDKIRAERYERQISSGLIPEGTVLPPRNTEKNYAVSPWDDLGDIEKETFVRYQEIYAAMVDNVDQNFGRLRQELEAIGEWENTVVIFTSDNGASREGLDNGTSAYFRTLISQVRKNPLDSIEVDNSRLDLLGGPQALAHYPNGWAMASNTPFRLYKPNTHQGGHQVPLIISKGGKAIMTDPDLPSGTDRVFAAFSLIQNKEDYESIINLQGDMPLIDYNNIQSANMPLHNGYDIGTIAISGAIKKKKTTAQKNK